MPELASRAHLVNLLPLVDLALQRCSLRLRDLDGVAVTAGPGLLGALLVGLSTAKALARAAELPMVGIHHIEGHILANALTAELVLPAVVLVVSGGHTELVLMRGVGQYERLGGTVDDAAGEAFDKTAKLLGLPYPGGPALGAARAGARRGGNAAGAQCSDGDLGLPASRGPGRPLCSTRPGDVWRPARRRCPWRARSIALSSKAAGGWRRARR